MQVTHGVQLSITRPSDNVISMISGDKISHNIISNLVSH